MPSMLSRFRPLAAALLAVAVLVVPAAAAAQEPAPEPAAAACRTAEEQSVATDKPTYGNFETVTVTGAGYAPACELVVEIVRPDGSIVIGDGTETPGSDRVSSDETGAFTYAYTLGAIDGDYVVNVRDGATNEVLATATFIDGVNVTLWRGGYGGTETGLFRPGQTVYVETEADTSFWSNKWFRVHIKTPGASLTKTACELSDDSFFGGTTKRFSHTLASATNVSGYYEIRQFNSSSACQTDTDPKVNRRANFYVPVITTSAGSGMSPARHWFKPSERAWASITNLPNDSNWNVYWDGPGDRGCDNVAGSNRPDSSGGVLNTLAYRPLNDSSAGSWNDQDAYDTLWWGDCPALVQGDWHLRVTSSDNGFDQDLDVLLFRVDGTDPTASHSMSTGWSTSPVPVTLTAGDAYGAVDVIRYRVNGAGAWLDYDNANKPRLNHGQYLQYKALDEAGNASAERTTPRANVDGQAPTITGDIADAWSKTPVEVTLTYADNGPSGVDAGNVLVSKNGTDWTAYDPASKPRLTHDQQLFYKATDNAGNTATGQTRKAKVDGDVPSISGDIADAWSKDPVEVELTYADNGPSGIAEVVVSKNGTDWSAYDPANKPQLAHDEQLFYKAIDRAGNEAAGETRKAKVDGDAPTISDDVAGVWSTTPVQVTLTVADNGPSGIAQVLVSEDGTTWTDYDPDSPPTLDHDEQLQYKAIDRAGNEATGTTLKAQVDHDDPTSSDDVDEAWHNAPIEVTLTGGDELSGLREIRYLIVPGNELEDRGVTDPGSVYDEADKPVLQHGEAIRYWAIDASGREQPKRTSNVAKVDQDLPTVTDDVPATEVDGPFAVTLTGQDALSGIKEIRYEIPGAVGETVLGAEKPVLQDGQAIRYWAVDNAGNASAPTTSAALRVRKPVVVEQQQQQPRSIPRITGLTVAPSCVYGIELGAKARKGRVAVALRFRLSEAAKVELNIQRRNPSAVRTSCKIGRNVRKPGARYETLGSGSVTGDSGSNSRRLGATAAKATVISKIQAQSAAVPGANAVQLSKLIRGKRLKPGTYRVLAVAVSATGERSAPVKAIFRVVG